MRRVIKLPAPQLSILKEVNIDLDMAGTHYAELASSENKVPEDVCLSILKDLMEEDANKLILSELRYLFILVKINSLEDHCRVSVVCKHKNKNGEICGHENPFDFSLAEADLNPTPPDYKVPEIDFVINGTEKTYKILPPPMNLESELYNYFLTEKNIDPSEIFEDKAESFNYSYLRGVMHLVDKDTGERFVTAETSIAGLFNHLKENSFKTINKLFDAVIEESKYGVQNKEYTIKCKECGGTLVFQIPLLAGLLD